MVHSLLGIFSCFKSTLQGDQVTIPNESLSSTSVSPSRCKFCNPSAERGFNIAYEDDYFVAFTDRKPASRYHYLVVPRRHIESVRSLSASDVELVKDMREIGNSLMASLDIPHSMRVMGFHIPPFNSVYHLHLHVQALPYRSQRVAAKYPIRDGFGGYSKGLTWFAEVNQVIQILSRQGHVGVMPC